MVASVSARPTRGPKVPPRAITHTDVFGAIFLLLIILLFICMGCYCVWDVRPAKRKTTHPHRGTHPNLYY